MGETHGNRYKHMEALNPWCEYHVFLYAPSRPWRDIFLPVSLEDHLYFLLIKAKFGMTLVIHLLIALTMFNNHINIL
jgi:hypothetical protein